MNTIVVVETSSQIFPLILQVVVGLLQFSISTVTLVVYVPFLRSFTIYIHVKLSSLVSILFTPLSHSWYLSMEAKNLWRFLVLSIGVVLVLLVTWLPNKEALDCNLYSGWCTSKNRFYSSAHPNNPIKKPSFSTYHHHKNQHHESEIPQHPSLSLPVTTFSLSLLSTSIINSDKTTFSDFHLFLFPLFSIQTFENRKWSKDNMIFFFKIKLKKKYIFSRVLNITIEADLGCYRGCCSK